MRGYRIDYHKQNNNMRSRVTKSHAVTKTLNIEASWVGVWLISEAGAKNLHSTIFGILAICTVSQHNQPRLVPYRFPSELKPKYKSWRLAGEFLSRIFAVHRHAIQTTQYLALGILHDQLFSAMLRHLIVILL